MTFIMFFRWACEVEVVLGLKKTEAMNNQMKTTEGFMGCDPYSGT